MKKQLLFLFLFFTCSMSEVYSQTDTAITIVYEPAPEVRSNHLYNLARKMPAPPSKNMLYAELLGNGFAYSLNYERLIYSDEKLGISTRIGVAPGFLNIFTGFGLPLEANFTFLRHKGHMAEMGPGFTWFYGKSKYRNEAREPVTTPYYNVCDVTLRIGYKYSQPGGGFLFRAAFVPVFAVVSPQVVRSNDFFPFGKTFTPWAGISVGYAFRK